MEDKLKLKRPKEERMKPRKEESEERERSLTVKMKLLRKLLWLEDELEEADRPEYEVPTHKVARRTHESRNR